MKRFLVFLISIFLLFASACTILQKESYIIYSEEKYKADISALTEEKFKSQIESGEIANYKVEIIYIFYKNIPGYFLVELEYAEEFETSYVDTFFIYDMDEPQKVTIAHTTKYQYIMGYINEDEYYLGVNGYNDFINGRNPYDAFGYGDAKKYYGGSQHAVEVDGKRLRIYGGPGQFPPELQIPEYSKEQYYLTEEEEKRLMTDNPPGFVQKYWEKRE